MRKLNSDWVTVVNDQARFLTALTEVVTNAGGNPEVILRLLPNNLKRLTAVGAALTDGLMKPVSDWISLNPDNLTSLRKLLVGSNIDGVTIGDQELFSPGPKTRARAEEVLGWLMSLDARFPVGEATQGLLRYKLWTHNADSNCSMTVEQARNFFFWRKQVFGSLRETLAARLLQGPSSLRSSRLVWLNPEPGVKVPGVRMSKVLEDGVQMHVLDEEEFLTTFDWIVVPERRIEP